MVEQMGFEPSIPGLQSGRICLYAHHKLEFASNLDYLEELKKQGFHI